MRRVVSPRGGDPFIVDGARGVAYFPLPYETHLVKARNGAGR